MSYFHSLWIAESCFSQNTLERVSVGNVPCNQIVTGYRDYLKIGVNTRKLIIGMPRNGCQVSCIVITKQILLAIFIMHENLQSISCIKNYGLQGIGLWSVNYLHYSGDSLGRQQTKTQKA
ncbi:hypothetical protein A6R68_17897, partial [Neotoma lepida]